MTTLIPNCLGLLWTLLVGARAPTTTARHHASTTTKNAEDEQPNAHNRENILQIHVCLQELSFVLRTAVLKFKDAAKIGQEGHNPNRQVVSFGRAPLIAGFYLCAQLALLFD